MTPLLEAADLTYAYPDGRLAVRSVTLSLEQGETVGLLGPNGAGKTSLFLLLAGLLEPRQGGVKVLGKPFGPRADVSLRRHIGFVAHETEDQLFSSSVFDDVAFGPLNFGMEPDRVRRAVRETLERVGLGGYEPRVPHHLSSGERRRVALATVLSYQPDLLILDEPSSGLDPRGRRELIDLLNSSREARIVASHDLEFILRTCARAIVLDAGHVVADRPVPEIISDHELLEGHGLEAPLGLRGRSAVQLRALLAGA